FTGSTTWSLLAAAAPTLTDLRLLCIPPEHAWDALALGPAVQQTLSQKHPAFAQLRTLSMHFCDDPAAANALHHPRGPMENWASRAAMQFPQLRRLSVRNPPVDVRAVLGAFVRRKGAALRVLELETTAALATHLQPLDIGRHGAGAESVAVSCVGLGPLGPDRADRLARQLLGSASQSVRNLKVSVAAQLPVQLGGVSLQNCSQLRSLELRMPVALTDVAAMVQQLPYLWRLKAPYIATADLPSYEVRSLDRFYTLMTSEKPKASVSRTLEIIHVGFWDYRHSARALCCHLLHFAVRLPALRTIVHDAQPAVALQSAVDALALIHQRQSRWSPHHNTHSNAPWLDNLRDLRITTHSAKPF
ncbi:hypothetical protein H4R20_005324, partial [Coemansia guatemalensis]